MEKKEKEEEEKEKKKEKKKQQVTEAHGAERRLLEVYFIFFRNSC